MRISPHRPCHFMHALHFIHSVKKELIKMMPLVIRVISLEFGMWYTYSVGAENHSPVLTTANDAIAMSTTKVYK